MGSKKIQSLNLEFSGSLDKFVHPEFGFLYTCYNAWNTHHMPPFNGSFSKQPNKIIEYFNILDDLRIEKEIESQKEAQREAKRKAKK